MARSDPQLRSRPVGSRGGGVKGYSRVDAVGLEVIQKTSIVGNCGSVLRQSHK